MTLNEQTLAQAIQGASGLAQAFLAEQLHCDQLMLQLQALTGAERDLVKNRALGLWVGHGGSWEGTLEALVARSKEGDLSWL